MGLTIAQLSLELNVRQSSIRDLLRDFGERSEEPRNPELDHEWADALRARLSGHRTDRRIWTLEIGDTVLRKELHAAYGGQRQSGIITPKSVPDILIVTNPGSAAQHGYDKYEGLQADGSFAYTGQGQVGHQHFKNGNGALRDAAEKGRPIRLFTKSNTSVTYIGEFTTGQPSYSVKRITDSKKNLRDGIIFNLIPVDADMEELEPALTTPTDTVQESPWTPPDFSPLVIEAPAPPGPRTVSRIEFELQRDFGEWISNQGKTPLRLQLHSAGATIEPDLYVEESGWVVEAKKSSAREFVRAAIGQVLDYARLVRLSGRGATPVILLPGRPVAHIEALLFELGILLIVRDDNAFAVIQ
ncbi:hypothetical protein [Microbacterium saperdae]|uniref:hypothetical protein n=1 Tax=Microbacterium saperdae TaxID=69368 RepID=UPI001E535B9C|nr:hypothetical protein [Microbacterium saperdae]